MTALVGPDVTLAELDELARSIDDNARQERLLAGRIRRLRASRAKGRSWNDILSAEDQPGTLELASRVLRGLTIISGRVRRTLARGLRAQGESISDIAQRFGVSHQRVSALLRRDEGSPAA